MILRLMRFSFIRMFRGYLAWVLLFVVPLCLITVLGLASGQMGSNADGATAIDWISVNFVVSFQLFGGAYTMSFIQEDLFKDRKWRMRSLPIRIDVYGYSLLLSSTFFSAMQGLILVLYSDWVLGAEWGNVGWVLFVLLIVSFFSQLVCLILALTVRRFKTAERLSEVYGFGAMILAGVMFRLPDTPFYRFISTYSNPVSLGRNAILIRAHEMDHTIAYLSIGLLGAAALILAAIAAGLGRTKFV